MIDVIVTWATLHPLPTVGILVGISVGAGLLLLPGLREVYRHGHPRC